MVNNEQENTNMKKKYIMIGCIFCILFLLLLLHCYCNFIVNIDSNKSLSIALPEKLVDTAKISYPIECTSDSDIMLSADLNHDGALEQIVVGVNDFSQYSELSIRNENKVVWKHEYSLAYESICMLYLYRENNMDYMIEYIPKMHQGDVFCSFKIFDIDHLGNENIKYYFEIKFSIFKVKNGVYYEELDCDIDELGTFIETVNSYIDNSLLIVSTDNGNLLYSKPDELITAYHDFSDIINIYNNE